MEFLEKILIPLVTILASLAGSIYVTFRLNTKTHTQEWLNQLREALAAFLSIGSAIPKGATETELQELRKRLVFTSLLLNPAKESQKSLLIKITALFSYLSDNFKNSNPDTKGFSTLYADVLTQFFTVAEEERARIDSPLMFNKFHLKSK